MRAVAAVLLAATACAAEAPVAPPPAPTTAPAPPPVPSTVPSTAPATAPPPTVLPLPRAGRGAARTTVAHDHRPAVEVEGDDFWHRLAMCESGMRVTHNRYVGFFQFSRDTARKVGIDGSEPYEEQRAAAQEWARRIHPNEGTRSGWPVCWWKAAS